MSPVVKVLPIFPIKAVLFPGSTLSVRVFEENHKLLMQRGIQCGSRMGVSLINPGSAPDSEEPYQIGTEAHMAHISRLDDGRTLVILEGQNRFRVKRILRRLPYTEALIEILQEENESIPANEWRIINRVVTEYTRLLHGLGGGWVRDCSLPQDTVKLSYHIAGLLQSKPDVKQALLEEQSSAKRLITELKLLQQETTDLRTKVVREFSLRRFNRN